MTTVLEYLWVTDRMTVLRLLGLGLISGTIVEALVGIQLPVVEVSNEYERLMRHDAYRRARGGALRQVKWG